MYRYNLSKLNRFLRNPTRCDCCLLCLVFMP